ncbi:CvfB family protein [Tissierellaceae bacterium HCP3S3_D8]
MIELGEMQELIIKRFTSVGAFLNEEREEDEDILLPKSQIPKDAKIGDRIEVFVYNDSKDRLISTTKRPKIVLGELAHLMVVDTTKIGVFLDWGLEKDLFLPFAETVGSLEKGKKYLVGMYIDKSHRLCATMKVRDMLRADSPYKENDITKGTIYSINKNIGAFVAVDDKYDGLIPKRELLGVYEVGEVVEVRVSRVLEDGKLDLTLKDRSYIQMDTDGKTILKVLEENGGILKLNDKSSPELIKKELNMSKSGFKRAVGGLLKEGQIEFIKDGIKLKK